MHTALQMGAQYLSCPVPGHAAHQLRPALSLAVTIANHFRTLQRNPPEASCEECGHRQAQETSG